MAGNIIRPPGVSCLLILFRTTAASFQFLPLKIREHKPNVSLGSIKHHWGENSHREYEFRSKGSL